MNNVTAPYDGEKFNNLEPFKDKSFSDLLRWRFKTVQEKWPERVETPTTKPSLERVYGDSIHYTLIGHATVLIQVNGINILTDPVYAQRSSPVSWAGPKRVRRPAINFDDLPIIDVVIISHNHYDHLDLETLKRLGKKFNPHFFVGLKNGKLLKAEGIERVVEMDWWQKSEYKDLKIHFVPAQHWSARGLFDRFETLWGGFFIEVNEKKIYFAGDTGYGKFFSLIKEKLGAPDLSFIPIGAYEPRWFMKDSHINPEDAVKAHHDLGSSVSVGMHFETFQLTNEAFDTPRKEFNEAWKASKKKGQFFAPEFGNEYKFKKEP